LVHMNHDRAFCARRKDSADYEAAADGSPPSGGWILVIRRSSTE
jgi:hypothetical protein